MTIADEILKEEAGFTFSGDPSDPIKRHITGLYSFDQALSNFKGDIGMPIGCAYEVYGHKGIGKSTFCYSMAGMIAKSFNTNIHLSDLEGFNSAFLGDILRFNKFSGDVHLGHQGTDNKILEDFEDIFHKREKYKNLKIDYEIGILDSIAAISPSAERDGDLEGANMGRRALLMNQFSRRLLPTSHPRTVGSEKIYFLVNHWLPKLDAYGGYTSPGGTGKNYLCSVQIYLLRDKISYGGERVKRLPDGSYRLKGILHKNRHGFDGTSFKVFMKAGVGIHKGLTAMFDCFDLKLATRVKTVKLEDKSFGPLKNIIKNEWKNDEFFQPFYDALKENEK